ncbi:UNVERIFIED_ORG: phage gp46-like protein [Citrobacter freundii]|uniref:phage GP46 family protein n=1 Tax=Citrobacter portucalensis TaxID=1639133 RepID=UPI001154C074|nr:phage GP46 family protein [Citrobacter portucalensis]NUH52173.1 phage GP46 family protein [Citrobacter portucalensis]NUH52718.1 phage GP46 family protein [Citrobacter portucalensis]NUH54009.1 phage GP46 family protein [Citrobacter portucalensis]
MDQNISTATGDYTRSRIYTLQNAVYLRLATPLGSYWADTLLGSRLHELKREKDVSRVHKLAAQYASQALQPLLDDGRAKEITVDTQKGRTGWLLLLITVTDNAGTPQKFEHPVRIA